MGLVQILQNFLGNNLWFHAFWSKTILSKHTINKEDKTKTWNYTELATRPFGKYNMQVHSANFALQKYSASCWIGL